MHNRDFLLLFSDFIKIWIHQVIFSKEKGIILCSGMNIYEHTFFCCFLTPPPCQILKNSVKLLSDTTLHL